MSSTKSVPSVLIKLLYLVIVVRVSSKRRVRPGLAISNALNTITSPITISYRKASSLFFFSFLQTNRYLLSIRKGHSNNLIWARED